MPQIFISSFSLSSHFKNQNLIQTMDSIDFNSDKILLWDVISSVWLTTSSEIIIFFD